LSFVQIATAVERIGIGKVPFSREAEGLPSGPGRDDVDRRRE